MEPSAPAPPAPAAPCLIRLAGRDALAVLHRISTQALADLAPGTARVTLFCDFRGRLLHRAAVGVTADGAAWLVRDDAPAAELAAHVDRHVFRDDVRIADATAGRTVRGRAGGVGLAPGALAERDGVPVALQIAPDFGFAIAEGEPEPETDAAAAAREAERIAAGRPRHGREVSASFTPFEVGLAHEVHLDKGCFSGQEALLRLVTYGGVRRGLAKVGGPGAAPAAPREVRSGGRPVGLLTSAAPSGAGWIGLAVLRREALAAGAPLELDGGGALGPPVAFPATRPLGLP